MCGFDSLREAVAVDGERASGRHLMGVGALKDDRTERAHLAMQDPDRIGRGVVRSEGIRADQLGRGGTCGARPWFGSAAFRAEPPEPRNSPPAMQPPSRPVRRQ